MGLIPSLCKNHLSQKRPQSAIDQFKSYKNLNLNSSKTWDWKKVNLKLANWGFHQWHSQKDFYQSIYNILNQNNKELVS